MKIVVSLGSLLVLGSAWILQGLHISLETPILSQNDFDLSRFMGQWYEAAVASTCLYYMSKKSSKVIVPLVLQHPSEQNFTMTITNFRNGTCKETSTVFGLTDHPGQFFHHVASLTADVDSYVVHTNYDEYALMILLSTDTLSGKKTTIVKLYSRTVDVRAAVLDYFKTLVRLHEISDDTVIVNENKGECLPSQQATEPNTHTQIPEPKG